MKYNFKIKIKSSECKYCGKFKVRNHHCAGKEAYEKGKSDLMDELIKEFENIEEENEK